MSLIQVLFLLHLLRTHHLRLLIHRPCFPVPQFLKKVNIRLVLMMLLIRETERVCFSEADEGWRAEEERKER